jgi:hypothetical protein
MGNKWTMKNPIHAGNHTPETIHAPSMAAAGRFQTF